MNMNEIDQAYKKWDKERTEEAKKLYVWRQNMNEIILLIYIYVDELSNNAIQLTSVWC